ncbi:hypothetical protein Hanom_Chr07g00671591 [Helianthus anomalus]
MLCRTLYESFSGSFNSTKAHYAILLIDLLSVFSAFVMLISSRVLYLYLKILLELIARMVPVVSCFFTFNPHLLKIAGMLPMVCYFVTRIVPEYMSVSLEIAGMLPMVCQGTIRVTK